MISILVLGSVLNRSGVGILLEERELDTLFAPLVIPIPWQARWRYFEISKRPASDVWRKPPNFISFGLVDWRWRDEQLSGVCSQPPC